MDSEEHYAALRKAREAWAQRHHETFQTESQERFLSDEGVEARRVYTPLDLAEKGFGYLADLGLPGEYPFTRAITPTLYRGGLRRISQYSGYATPEECNELWRAQVQNGLNTIYIAYDLPTQLGYDSDHPVAYLTRVVGAKKARETWMLCRRYNAQQALEMGLVNTVVPLEKLEEEADKWCEEILALNPTCIEVLKATFDSDIDYMAGSFGRLSSLMAPDFFEGPDPLEAAEAFFQKRKPDFWQFREGVRKHV